MIAAKSNELEIVRDAISNARNNDEAVQASVSVLAERLERLKKRCNLFADVEFSSDVQRLAENAVALS
ncbi:hypothetical protein STSP2_03325 [Anaerohalosphaera lusitana]|uniref:Uncharacterized protein n=1 Tax=Anaerohalosphaera lusitana TaxID=1936003 RepID=A0A1U9NQB4_9BACT|nr:hypothetical protein [Anaerohalosphaera lusitana]AQT70121.1 hypothetical protein STSP2_03325 [Anaerohalosphaera lusitana]